MKLITFLFFVLITGSHCLENIGDECYHEGIVGVCKRFEECVHAQHLVVVMKRKPTTCFFGEDMSRQVCCLDGVTDADPSTTTALPSNNTGCRYNGKDPVECCGRGNSDQETVPPEPTNCPPLPRPRLQHESDLQPYQQTVLDACYEYSKLASWCQEVESEFRGSYERKLLCRSEDMRPVVAAPASVGELPHTAVLGFIKENDPEWIGGGALISEYYVLTSATAAYHDVYGDPKFALLGASNKSHLVSGVRHCVAEIQRHPSHRVGELLHDLALLKLDSRVVFSEFVRPACLRLPGLQVTPERIVTSWGDGETSALLRMYTYESHRSVCEKRLAPGALWDDRRMICAVARTAARNPTDCQSGSGGALLAKLKELPCAYTVVGIAAGGNCNTGVYTNLLHTDYTEWVTRYVWT